MLLLMVKKECPGCGKYCDSSSGSETWHEPCFQEHKAKGPCAKHAVCKGVLFN